MNPRYLTIKISRSCEAGHKCKTHHLSLFCVCIVVVSQSEFDFEA